MSELFDVTVVNRGTTWADLLVKQVHPDAGSIPASGCFALQLILKRAYGFDESYNYIPVSPIGEMIEHEKSYQPEDVVEVVDDYIASVRVYRAANVPFVEEDAHAAVDEVVRARGIDEGSDEWEDAWVEVWNDWWERADGPPRAILRVEVTDPRWVEHLEPGERYGSATFDPWGPYVEENIDEEPERLADAVVPWDVVDFPMAAVARGERDMEHEMIRELASAGEALQGEALEELVSAHAAFVASGGGGGMWQNFSVSGLPMCVYMGGKGEEGEQLVLRLKSIASGASLQGRDLRWADLSGSICEGVSFQNATLDHSMAIDAFFDGADFSGASLREVDFSGSSLKGCNFSGADLRGTDFEHTDCSGADFRGARLDGSRFPGAILDDVRR